MVFLIQEVKTREKKMYHMYEDAKVIELLKAAEEAAYLAYSEIADLNRASRGAFAELEKTVFKAFLDTKAAYQRAVISGVSRKGE